MKHLKILAMAVVFLFLVASLAACGAPPEPNQPSSTGTPGAEPAQKKQLVYLSPNHGNPFWTTVAKGVEEACATMGADVTVYDAQDDPAKQVNQAEDALLKGIDALLVSPFETDTGTAIAELANAAGVPVFILDNGCNAEYNAFISSDNEQGGRIAAEYILEKVGSAVHVAEMQGLVGREIPARRGVGFNKVMTEKNVPVVFSQPADFNRAKGMSLMETYLTQDKTLNAIFCWNDEMALGAKEAIAANGLTDQIFLVGFDAIEEACQAVAAGQMAATVAQNPYEFGKKGVELAFKEFNGESYEKDILIECILVTKDNVADFLG